MSLSLKPSAGVSWPKLSIFIPAAATPAFCPVGMLYSDACSRHEVLILALLTLKLAGSRTPSWQPWNQALRSYLELRIRCHPLSLSQNVHFRSLPLRPNRSTHPQFQRSKIVLQGTISRAVLSSPTATAALPSELIFTSWLRPCVCDNCKSPKRAAAKVRLRQSSHPRTFFFTTSHARLHHRKPYHQI